jgi:hypothetical protein
VWLKKKQPGKNGGEEIEFKPRFLKVQPALSGLQQYSSSKCEERHFKAMIPCKESIDFYKEMDMSKIAYSYRESE